MTRCNSSVDILYEPLFMKSHLGMSPKHYRDTILIFCSETAKSVCVRACVSVCACPSGEANDKWVENM